MARPIKETPVLKGADARRFERQIKENEKRQVPESDYKRALRAYERVRLAPT